MTTFLQQRWNGSSSTRKNAFIENRAPDFEDWNRIAQEMWITQSEIIYVMTPAIQNLVSNVTTLQSRATADELIITSHTSSIQSLQSRATATEASIAALQNRAATDELIITSHTSSIQSLQSRATASEASITSHTDSIQSLQSRVAANEANITTLQSKVTANTVAIAALQFNLTWNVIAGLSTVVGYNSPSYAKLNNQILLRGVTTVKTLKDGDLITTLPLGYRPLSKCLYQNFTINIDGTVRSVGNQNGNVSFDNVCFYLN